MRNERSIGSGAARAARARTSPSSIVVLLAIAVAFGAVPPAAGQARPSLFVFVLTEVKARTLEQMLETELPAVDVTVYSRYGDFRKDLAASPPDAILAPSAVLEAEGLPAVVQGMVGTKATESYVLVTVGSTDPAAADLTVGSVDMLGRRNMPGVVGRLLGRATPPRIVTVTKLEDLLPLLQFGSAGAVLLPTRALAQLEQRTKLALRPHALAGEVGLPGVASRSSQGRTIAGRVKNLRAATNETLGVRRWQDR
jgi:hypothetical protein